MTVQIKEPDVRLLHLAVDHAAYRRKVIFRCYKWDPQVEDSNTISDHACVLSQEAASRLSRLAELLAAETLELERTLARRPELFAELGISRGLRSALARSEMRDSHVRVMRFDFHPTLDGWALSEVNSDVPGGFAEASALPVLAAQHVSGTRPGGDVAGALIAAFSNRIGRRKRLAFVHATAYADDRQVMQFLADRFAAAGFDCALVAPDHLRWKERCGICVAHGHAGAIDGLVRFFPAEWLPALSRRADWRGYFRAPVLACNPPWALLTQSKRLPLLWDRLGVSVPTWRATLPETRDPRDAPWRRDEGWLVKPGLGRVGESIAWLGGDTRGNWRKTTLRVLLSPRSWIAQRRFQSRPLLAHDVPRHLCIGVFTVDGRAAGFYGRLSPRTIIEKHAQDVPILVSGALACG
jgi:glutathionylspermidine synthase